MLLLLPGRGVLVVHTDCRVHGDPRAEITEAAKKWRHYSSATADEAPPVLPSYSFSIHRRSPIWTTIDKRKRNKKRVPLQFASGKTIFSLPTILLDINYDLRDEGERSSAMLPNLDGLN